MPKKSLIKTGANDAAVLFVNDGPVIISMMPWVTSARPPDGARGRPRPESARSVLFFASIGRHQEPCSRLVERALPRVPSRRSTCATRRF